MNRLGLLNNMHFARYFTNLRYIGIIVGLLSQRGMNSKITFYSEGLKIFVLTLAFSMYMLCSTIVCFAQKVSSEIMVLLVRKVEGIKKFELNI